MKFTVEFGIKSMTLAKKGQSDVSRYNSQFQKWWGTEAVTIATTTKRGDKNFKRK